MHAIQLNLKQFIHCGMELVVLEFDNFIVNRLRIIENIHDHIGTFLCNVEIEIGMCGTDFLKTYFKNSSCSSSTYYT